MLVSANPSFYLSGSNNSRKHRYFTQARGLLFRTTLHFTSARAQLLCLSCVGSPAGLLESVILPVRGQPLIQNTSFYLGFQLTAGSQQYSEEQSSFYLSAVPLGLVALILPKRRPSSGLYQMALKGTFKDLLCSSVCSYPRGCRIRGFFGVSCISFRIDPNWALVGLMFNPGSQNAHLVSMVPKILLT